jgi:RNA polymerase sigma factor (TIGR02999 family)
VTADPSEITALLVRIADGDPDGLDRLMPLVYDQLRRMAASQLRRERAEHTLNPTSLVHEAFLRLVQTTPLTAQGRAHFFGIAASAMRRILVEHARKRHAQKRSQHQQSTLDTNAESIAGASSAEILDVDEALARLALLSARQAQVVELRYFGGLSLDEIADVRGVSLATVKRDWVLARAWLQRELSADS